MIGYQLCWDETKWLQQSTSISIARCAVETPHRVLDKIANYTLHIHFTHTIMRGYTLSLSSASQVGQSISVARPLFSSGGRLRSCSRVSTGIVSSLNKYTVSSNCVSGKNNTAAPFCFGQEKKKKSFSAEPRRESSTGSSVVVRANDPSMEGSQSDAAANQGPPTLFWRVFAALCYLVPWIDSISLGREIYRRFRNLLVLYLVPGPLAKVYFSSQFAPLIIFFVMFLSIVKNKKLHHFVRFNCMQAIMLDIVVMLMHIVKAYLPAEIKWSVISHFVDMFMWTTCMGTVVYAVFWTLRGYYADIPFVSESVYHQVALSEYA